MVLILVVVLTILQVSLSIANPDPNVNVMVDVKVLERGSLCNDAEDCSKQDHAMCRPNGCKIWEVKCATRTCKGSNCFCCEPKVIPDCGVVFGEPGYGNLSIEDIEILASKHMGEPHLDCRDENSVSKSFFWPVPSDIEFRLYTRKNPNIFHRLITNNKPSVDSSSLNSSQPMVVIAHGFRENANTTTWMGQIKDILLAKNPMNVIIVQWATLADSSLILYYQAVSNCRFVGRHLAKLLNFLSYKELHPSNMHIIGFSLGGQLAGVAGHNLNNLARITGLSPAGPLFFSGEGPEDRLDKSDADFVDIIHTNAGILGYGYACGHVDFWMNGGSKQKGCSIDIDCSHNRAHMYYIESLKAVEPSYGFLCYDYETFETGHCLHNSDNSVGYGVTSTVKGSFYVDTEYSSPFLTRSISIGVTLTDNNNAYHCDMYVGMLVTGRGVETVEMSKGSVQTHPKSSFTKLVTTPSGTTLTSIQVSIEYKSIFTSTSWCPGQLDVKYIEAYDAFANTWYCVSGSIQLQEGNKVTLTPTPRNGSC